MRAQRTWTDFTYLFRTKRKNLNDGQPIIQHPDPAAVYRRRRIEALKEKRELDLSLADVWE